MSKVHLVVLYVGLALALALAAAALVVSGGGYADHEDRIAYLEQRESALTEGVVSLGEGVVSLADAQQAILDSIDPLYDLHDQQQRRIADLEYNVSANDSNIDSILEWSDEVVAYLNSGQTTVGGTDTNQILIDVIKAVYLRDPAAIARLAQHLLTLSTG